MFLDVSQTELNGVFWIKSKWKQQTWLLFQTLFVFSTDLTVCRQGVGESRGSKEGED